MRILSKNVTSFISTILICAVFFCPVSYSESVESSIEEEHWDSICSNHFLVYYRPDANLIGIERELNTRGIDFDQAARYGEITITDEICNRLDKLFSRVKELLNMYPKIPRVNIRIFKDRMELNEEHLKMFTRKADLSSYYIKECNTIYTSESDISDSIMAHEMAHVVIDHYFPIAPPKRVGEILASYVDAHIEE